MTQPGEPGYPGPQPEGTPKTVDLSNPEQHDSAAAPAAGDKPADEGRIAELENELGKLRAAAISGLKVLLRVGKPHDSLTYGGITITAEPTEVPARHAPAMQEAAARAGVTLIQED